MSFSWGYDHGGIGLGIGPGIGGFALGHGVGIGVADPSTGAIGYGAGCRFGLALGPALPLGFTIKIGRVKMPILFGLCLGPACGWGTKTQYRLTKDCIDDKPQQN